MESILLWGAVIGIGALLGAFLRLRTVGWVVGGLVAMAFVGGFGVVLAGVIRAEWLLLLMAVLPAAGLMFGAAALVNWLVGDDHRGDTGTG